MVKVKKKRKRQFIPSKRIGGTTRLPMVKRGKKWFFVDERLKELRNVNDPFDVIPF